ncbi:hypothetical protein P3T40_005345, partial [Paraburkholderia sp. EB58]
MALVVSAGSCFDGRPDCTIPPEKQIQLRIVMPGLLRVRGESPVLRHGGS